MEEKKMKSVEVSVWTPGLNLANITPVTKEYVTKYIENGETPDDVSEDFDFSIPVYFCDDRKVNITVKDGEEEKKYTEKRLNELDFGFISEAKDQDYEDWCERDDYDSDEEYAEAIDEARLDDEDCYCVWLTKNIDLEEAGPVFQGYWEECLEDCFGGLCNYLRPIAREAINNGEDDDMVNFLELGEIGKGEVSFRIEIPEGEEFDINKLHFICGGDIEDFPEGFDVFLSTSFTILDAVEYDGRIYSEKEVFFNPGWKDYYGGRFYDADLDLME